MTGWRGLILRLMRVPPEPAAPPGEGTRVFRAGRNFLRYKLVSWLIAQLSASVGLVFAFWFADNVGIPGVPREVLFALEVLGLAGFVAQLPLSLLVTVLDFEMRWYIVTDRSLRIRTGIWDIREMTMTFANIQQITVEQGPLQRLLGVADVMVRTAGGGSGATHDGHQKGAAEMMHLGYFHGVNNASEVRDLILERMRCLRDAGLGDPDDHEVTVVMGATAAVDSPAQRLALAVAEFAHAAREARAGVARS